MKFLFEHVERIKERPHHIRKRVAFTIAGAGTAVIALIWLVGGASSGAFAIKPTSFADVAGEAGIRATGGPGNGAENLAGAAAALEKAEMTAGIRIVDAASSTRSTKKAEQTTIPF